MDLKTFISDELQGGLALTARTSDESPPPGTVTIWVMSSMEESQWERRYSMSPSCLSYFPPYVSSFRWWNGAMERLHSLPLRFVDLEAEYSCVRWMPFGTRVEGLGNGKIMSRFNVKLYTPSLVRPGFL